jgi:hypothetical protein
LAILIYCLQILGIYYSVEYRVVSFFELMGIHIFTIIRNEAYLLKRWIPYHAAITGWQNLHIIDHNSDDKKCIEILRYYKNKGVDVIQTKKDFSLKARLITAVMHKYKSKASILIPMDADEFLCLADENQNMIADPAEIGNNLASIPVNGKKYAFNVFEAVVNQLDYVDPLIDMKYFIFYEGRIDASGPNQQTKSFFPSLNFSYTDQGNHQGRVLIAPNNVYNVTKMSIAHFHMRGYLHFVNKLDKAVQAYKLDTMTRDYVGVGMRWNRWYQETKELNDLQKKEWFIKNFMQENKGTKQSALSQVLQNI